MIISVRVDRCLRLPEYGPRILFFSGGTAIRSLSSLLKQYTHNSIHLMTPFDSGGSSAEIRRAFNVLSVGDIRNRLMALADDSVFGKSDVVALFSHRLEAENASAARDELSLLLCGEHELTAAVSMPMRSILISHLRWFHGRMPSDFNLCGASVGNLIITGCFLEHNNDIVTAIYLIWMLLGAKGRVRPLTGANLHIRALYEDGMVEVGQHKLGNSTTVAAHGKIVKIDFVERLPEKAPSSEEHQDGRSCEIDPVSAQLVSTADLIVFPMGSFFGSILVNLLPSGVGKTIVHRKCPKVYIPNTGTDNEMYGYTLVECACLIIDFVREDAGVNTPVHDILNYILVDTKNCDYCVPIDEEKIGELGVQLLDLSLADDNTKSCADQQRTPCKSAQLNPLKLAEVLLSLGS